MFPESKHPTANLNMSFDAYKNIGEVLSEFTIIAHDVDFILEIPLQIREYFQEDLAFCLKELSFEESEYSVCEMIIFPVLKEVFKNYKDSLSLWSHKSIFYDEKLSGIPDYIIAQRSPLGKQIFTKPYLIVVEAKKDDFIKGWGQCLAAMVAIQKINENLEKAVFGIVSNGQLWQFGQLQGNTLTKNIKAYTIFEIDKLLAALNYLFSQGIVANPQTLKQGI